MRTAGSNFELQEACGMGQTSFHDSAPLFSTTDSTTSTPVESLSQAILPAELEDRVAKMKGRGGQKMP